MTQLLYSTNINYALQKQMKSHNIKIPGFSGV